ncbi:DUF1045 domain-containing protein [uncultured Shimia sp.]|uniref:DUF1045 domain-containing protein n=1 Tax=uncultured Shimia sp. TaxID=573152 RepID=UPI00261D7857|nr:DUF1045 domain-containing protein [uncultured Shimia sp.]
MTEYTRFAVYFAPQEGAFSDFANRWLGWDATRGVSCQPPSMSGLPMTFEDITATPRKYGFHGTLKPPFRLAKTSTRAALENDLAALAKRQAPVSMEGLELNQIGRFLALVPVGDTTELAALASEVVRDLDGHRADLIPEELARRRAARLSARQEANLMRWGYPYVMDDFRFHLTLTGKLPKAMIDPVRTSLTPVLAPLLPRPFVLKDLCLFGEGEAGRFHVLRRFALTG